MSEKSLRRIFYIGITFLISSCGGDKPPTKDNSKSEKVIEIVSVPDFNADSAYQYVKAQCDFGPRVPNTTEHAECATWLFDKLSEFSEHTIIQEAKARAYDGTVLYGKNIICSFNPDAQKRILLCSHWDSRPYADHDKNPDNHRTPIIGANDGASGVGVLIEIARQLKAKPISIGIDIILFDIEDYGEPQGVQSNLEDAWGLGSQFWAKTPHKQGYYANFGILLDMVGAKDATFTMEGTSMFYAPDVVKKVWEKAHRIGYGNYFLYKETYQITDDHLYINQIIKIPTIDIIHHDDNTDTGFFKYWHTLNDNFDVIDKNTLKAVGQTVMTVIYEE
ncbi:MAG: M28 family peptidase [Saprospiraceae bacterium]|nr:M28 family peptidase [Saprospiraceae bacterium]